MLAEPFHRARVLTGPTGSGKSALALELAHLLGAEIISMDSMAIYRGMDIGTAKPTLEEQRAVPHHLVDVLDPWESASVAWWLEQAATAVRAIEARGHQALFVGGTPLYLKALLYGLFEGPPADPELRQRLEAEAEAHGSDHLHARLVKVDPLSGVRLHPNDRRRIVRALEVWEITGKPLSAWQTQWSPSTPEAPGNESYSCLRLDLPREELFSRINARVEQMIAAGLIEEAQRLRALDQPLSREASQAVGYQEIFDYLDNKISLKSAVERIQTRSRQFARRQLTWFRQMPQVHPVTRELTIHRWCSTMRP